MSKPIKILLIFFAFISVSVQAKSLYLVEENHAEIEKDGIVYILDSYIIPFEQPYYILIKREDKKSISMDQVESMAIEYILPRGCTQPLERRPDLDKQNEDFTAVFIGVAC